MHVRLIQTKQLKDSNFSDYAIKMISLKNTKNSSLMMKEVIINWIGEIKND